MSETKPPYTVAPLPPMDPRYALDTVRSVAAQYATGYTDSGDEQPVAPTAVTLREALAAYAHDAWAGWMRYLFEKSRLNPDGTVTIPAWAVDRWARQMHTPYAELPESEKASDRAEAAKMLALVQEAKARYERL